jgi:histidinol dehydrogenase
VVIADETARADWAAADLLAQAEHDVLASAILFTPSLQFARAVQAAVQRQLAGQGALALDRQEILAASLQNRSGIVLTTDVAEAIDLSNAYGPEHLNLVVADPWRWLERITTAGGVFVGEQSYEVLGDYMAGPSHVMPTSGTARFASPLNVWDFVRLVSLVAMEPDAARRIGREAALVARAEGLTAHARAAEMRQA